MNITKFEIILIAFSQTVLFSAFVSSPFYNRSIVRPICLQMVHLQDIVKYRAICFLKKISFRKKEKTEFATKCLTQILF